MPELIITGVVSAVVGLLLGALGGFFYRKKVGESKIGSAEEEAKRILDEASKSAEAKKKEVLIEAKEETLRLRNEGERELKERRSEVSRMERRLNQKEENLDRKTEALERKNEQLDEKLKANDALREQIGQALEVQVKKLEEISNYTAEEAKQELLLQVETETRYEMAQRMDELEAQFKEEADAKARNLLSLAIQRCAADHVTESTISVVALPSEEMKGRIIGREGRNIQKLETLTGVELIIDDTPEAITISGFDPVRREVARLALEKLIADGRIHPARIEEMVEKSRREVDAVIKQAGERATYEVNVHGIHPELVRLLGRLRSDGFTQITRSPRSPVECFTNTQFSVQQILITKLEKSHTHSNAYLSLSIGIKDD